MPSPEIFGGIGMRVDIWLTFVSTVLILMITPGPSQLLMLSNSLGAGFKRSTATAAGDLSANAIQMAVAAIGLASILYASQYTFLITKWLGVAYLLVMGLWQIRQRPPKKLSGQPQQVKSIRSLYTQGFVTSASNPKAIIFFAALFPQFLNPNEPIAGQLFILGMTYVVLDGFFLALYGSFADWLAQRFKGQVAGYLNQLSGAFLIGAAVLLGLKRVET
jgi:threonine/homoserine/homoserine lactone efflux protein